MRKLRNILGINALGLALLVAGCASPRFPEPQEGVIVRYQEKNDGKFRYSLPIGDADAQGLHLSLEEREKELVQNLVFYKGVFEASFEEYTRLGISEHAPRAQGFSFSIDKLKCDFENNTPSEFTADGLY